MTTRWPSAARVGERCRVDVDDDEALAGVGELAGDGRADPAVAAQDEVAPQAVDRLSVIRFASRRPLTASDRTASATIPTDPKMIADPGDRHDDGPRPPEAVELADLLVADRRQRDPGHVDRVARAASPSAR